MLSPFNISEKIKALELSPTLALTASAQKLKSQGIDIISLGAGEPDLQPPRAIIESLQEAANLQGACAYTATAGLPELRKVIAQWLQSDRGLAFDPDDIIVTPGCKMAIFQSLFTLLNPGDEVIFGRPYWVSYPQIIRACQGIPVPVTTDLASKFLISALSLEAAITSKSKVLILNSPHNPTGQVHVEADLHAIAACLRKHPHLVIICDDIYDSLAAKSVPHILHVAPDLASRTVIINGLSKSFGVTGWRLGFAAAPKILIEAMTRLQSQTATCVATPIQYAAISAYQYPHRAEFFAQAAALYRMRAQIFTREISQCSDIDVLPMDSSFYIWANVTSLLKKINLTTDSDLAQKWLLEAAVSTIPGSAFGMPGFIRFSVTQPEHRLIEAATRIQDWIKAAIGA